MKSALRKLKEAVEQDWKDAIKRRDKKCQRCGSGEILQAHHIKSRANASTFFDLKNGVLLCRKCHCWITFADDEVRRDFHISKVGEKEYLRLDRKSRQVKDWTIEQLKRKRGELCKAFQK